jgi:hypothetical protein
MRLDLIDEFHLGLHPYVADEGTQLFDDVPKGYPLDLVSSTASSNGVVELQYPAAPLTQRASPQGGSPPEAVGRLFMRDVVDATTEWTSPDSFQTYLRKSPRWSRRVLPSRRKTSRGAHSYGPLGVVPPNCFRPDAPH